MVKVTAKVTGGGRLSRFLRELPSEMTLNVRQAIRREAMLLTVAVRARAPVLSGLLKSSIRAKFSQKGLRARVGIFGIKKERHQKLKKRLMSRKKNPLGKRAASRQASEKLRDPFYARFVEFGTKKMKAQPYLFATYRAKRRAIYATIAREAKNAIRRVKK